jgi:hypothetical protein
VKKAAYVLLNFDDSSRVVGAPSWQGGAWQVGQAIAAIGSQAGALRFLAVDVEQPDAGNASKVNGILPVQPADKYRRVQRIAEAVQAVLDAGLRPIIYAFRGASDNEQWRGITGSSTAFSMFPLWHPNYAVNHVGGDGNNPLNPPPWEDALEGFVPFGGWIERSGRQYVDNRLDGGYKVDLNVFDPAMFVGNYTRPPVAVELLTASWHGTPPGAQVRVTGSGLTNMRLSRNPIPNRKFGTVTITNVGSQPIAGPLQLVFTGLTPGCVLWNASGNRGVGPYLILPVEAGGLLPGQPVTTDVRFDVNTTQILDYTPRVYSGYW